MAFIQSDAVSKTMEVTNELILGVDCLCGCGLNSSLISSSFLRCFDNSPQHVTYRAVLTRAPTLSTVELASLIRQWIEMIETIIVQSIGLSVDRMCPLVIVNYDSHECPEDITNCSSSSNTPNNIPTNAPSSSNTPTTLNPGAIVGGVVGGVVGLVAVIMLVSVVIILLHRFNNTE